MNCTKLKPAPSSGEGATLAFSEAGIPNVINILLKRFLLSILQKYIVKESIILFPKPIAVQNFIIVNYMSALSLSPHKFSNIYGRKADIVKLQWRPVARMGGRAFSMWIKGSNRWAENFKLGQDTKQYFWFVSQVYRNWFTLDSAFNDIFTIQLGRFGIWKYNGWQGNKVNTDSRVDTCYFS